MSQRDLTNFTYYLANEERQQGDQGGSKQDDAALERMLHTLASQAMKERTPTLEELNSALKSDLQNDDSGETQQSESAENNDSESITKLLMDRGYLRDDKHWLTKKGFIAIGNQILRDLMSNLNAGDFGMHEIKSVGSGTTVLDTTKKFELGGDLKMVNVPMTILNAVGRIAKSGPGPKFPLDVNIDDFEEFETVEDVRASVVYCIDLSSTMKSSLADSGMSRIDAAKRALWSLYILNSKFFPNDSITVVGFASMASVVNPLDIPFLKTYDANDEFLHYTNYQAAFRLAQKILQKDTAKNKRIVMITDGQPSACFVDNDSQKSSILSEKPYSNFYEPSAALLSKIKNERNIRIEGAENLVYLCYRYKKVDPKIDERTMAEAKKCRRDNIEIDTIVVGEETELLSYVQQMEVQLRGRTYHINQNNMDRVLVMDYLHNHKKLLASKTT